MPQPIVAIAGPAGSGKDTFADCLNELFGFKKMAFADPLREMALAIDPIVGLDYSWDKFGTVVRYSQALEQVGYNEAKFKYPEIRQFLQRLGTDAVRNVLGDSMWTDIAMERAVDIVKFYPGVAIADTRFQNEAHAVKDYGGIVVKVTRPGVAPLGDHVSEHDLDGWEFDYVIDNDGTVEELCEKAAALAHNLMAVSPMEGTL